MPNSRLLNRYTFALMTGLVLPALSATVALDTAATAAVQTAAENGEKGAALEMARRYTSGRQVPADSKLALQWYQKAAETGDAAAMFYLGKSKLLEVGGDLNQGDGKQWLLKAAGAGSRDAQTILGALNVQGEHYVTGVEWLQKAAQRGCTLSQGTLAALLVTGEGLPRDAAEAYYWSSLALRHEGERSPEMALGMKPLAEYTAILRECQARARKQLKAEQLDEIDLRIKAFVAKSNWELRSGVEKFGLSIHPEKVPAGGRFDLTVSFTARDPKLVSDSLTATFYYVILSKGQKVFEGTPIEFEGRNGSPSQKILKGLQAGKNSGTYQIEGVLKIADGVMSKPVYGSFVIE